MEPVTRKEKYLSVKATGSGTIPDPVTREEHFLAGMATGETDNLPEPITREEKFLDAAARGGSSVTVEPLSVTENGAYTADEGKAYSPVTVNVPQTEIEAKNITSNGTYTAESGKAFSPVTVNVDEVDPEVLTGTVAEPWTMAQAEALWDTCKPFVPSAAVLTCIPVNTMGVLQCVTLAGGSSTSRWLLVGASAPTQGGVGVVSIQYSLDSEGEPREHVSMDSKIAWVCTGDTAPQDVSALVSNSSPTKTLVSLYSNPVPLVDD